MKFAIFILTLCFSIACANAQPGCTDTQALNFNAAATQNDGSCTYPSTTYLPPPIAELPADLEEASGLAFFGHRLWTHRDGGNGTDLYVIDTLTGEVLQTFPQLGLLNVDWEDLAEDADYFYIGDFGNNVGNRNDLRIYKLKKADLLAGIVAPGVINFSFSDQTDFTAAYNANDYDCEAFFALGDSLHLFSKNWLDHKTRHYTLPKTPGMQVAQLRDSLEVGCLVTAADCAEDGEIVLLGYNSSTSETFLWLLFDYPNSEFFKGNKRKINLGTALNMSQAEGIAFSSKTGGFICSEKILVLPQRLLRFDIGQWVQEPSEAFEESDKMEISISPNPFSEFMNVDFRGLGEGQFSLVGADGKVLQSGELRSGKNILYTADLPAQTYFIRVKNGDRISVKKVVKMRL